MNKYINNWFYCKTKHFIVLMAALSLLCGYFLKNRLMFSHKETNSVYFWKTTFSPDSADVAFIQRHDIGRIYLRMFDVVVDHAIVDGDNTIPNATVKFPDETYRTIMNALSSVEFVPVVYVTLDALKAAKDNEDRLAENIVTRVKNMCSYNGLPNVSGLQLDCDWTASTEQSFFAVCKAVKAHFAKQNLQWKLSSTIRLHQLATAVPPVDYGVLMVYNTGSFNNPDVANSILDEKDVKPYIRHLDKYPLHLDIAYPTYSWQILFHKRQFAGLMYDVNVTDTTGFAPIDGTHTYRCLKTFPYGKNIVREGDIIRTEASEYQNIMRVKTMIEHQLDGNAHSNILYHFDLHNFSKYSDDELKTILSVQ